MFSIPCTLKWAELCHIHFLMHFFLYNFINTKHTLPFIIHFAVRLFVSSFILWALSSSFCCLFPCFPSSISILPSLCTSIYFAIRWMICTLSLRPLPKATVLFQENYYYFLFRYIQKRLKRWTCAQERFVDSNSNSNESFG